MALAEEVYDASPIVLDALSRGLATFSKVDVATLRAGTLATLEQLAPSGGIRRVRRGDGYVG